MFYGHPGSKRGLGSEVKSVHCPMYQAPLSIHRGTQSTFRAVGMFWHTARPIPPAFQPGLWHGMTVAVWPPASELSSPALQRNVNWMGLDLTWEMGGKCYAALQQLMLWPTVASWYEIRQNLSFEEPFRGGVGRQMERLPDTTIWGSSCKC